MQNNKLSKFFSHLFGRILILIIVLAILIILPFYICPEKVFYEGGGLGGSSLTIKLGYFYRVGEWSDIGSESFYGYVNYSDGNLILHQVFPDNKLRQSVYIDTLSIIKWEERTYLIPPADILQFCRNIDSLYEPRFTQRGVFLLSKDGWNIKVGGKPQLPKQYQDCIANSVDRKKFKPKKPVF